MTAAAKIGKWFLRMLALLAALGILFFRGRPDLRITFLDVGQGDGILIESGAFTCMIDGGSSSVKDVWEYRIERALKYYGITELDAVFLSHGDLDHISGTEELLEGYDTNILGHNIGGITVRQLILPDTGYEDERLQSLGHSAKEQGIPVGYLEAGGRIGSGDLQLLCLHPDSNASVGDSNEDSMVLRLEYGDFTALFTGDLEKEGERQFLERYLEQYGSKRDRRKIDVLKIGHHGSKYATSGELLTLLEPDLAVISCGENNSYGHPAPELEERLEEKGIPSLRTDQRGAVTICAAREGSWTVKTEVTSPVVYAMAE